MSQNLRIMRVDVRTCGKRIVPYNTITLHLHVWLNREILQKGGLYFPENPLFDGSCLDLSAKKGKEGMTRAIIGILFGK